MDHRILDGLTAHRIMLAIEAAMKEDIVMELTTAAALPHRATAGLHD
jgi:hypothetical protein